MTDDPASKPTLLVIDDAPENLTLVYGLLKSAYKVKVANNGERGLAIAATAPQPDLILLDVLMPGIDGWEVCRRLKAEPQTRHVPVVFLTAKEVGAEEAQMMRDLGAADHVAKPIDVAQLLASIQKHLA